jgi:hypothetical protein
MACQVTTIASAAETTIITAGTSGVSHPLVGLIITVNGTFAVGTVTIKDSTGGTTRMIVDYPSSAAAPSAPFIMFLPFDRWLYQAAPANNWTATCSAGSGTQTYHINAFYLEI